MQFIINATFLINIITQEMVIEYYQKGYSLSKIAEMTDLPISKVMEILKSNEQIISDEDLEEVMSS